MQKTVKYVIFKTKWGYFGLAGTDKGLVRTVLPAGREKVKLRLLEGLAKPKCDEELFKEVQKRITAYFQGSCVDFRDVPVALACPERSRGDVVGVFTSRVLKACRNVTFGQTISYGRLAELAGRAGAARAVGGVMAKNPLPLVIPCHRIGCANGRTGGFSAIGGVGLKKRMLELEARALKIGSLGKIGKEKTGEKQLNLW